MGGLSRVFEGQGELVFAGTNRKRENFLAHGFDQRGGAKQGFHFDGSGLANTTGTGAQLAVEVVL